MNEYIACLKLMSAPNEDEYIIEFKTELAQGDIMRGFYEAWRADSILTFGLADSMCMIPAREVCRFILQEVKP